MVWNVWLVYHLTCLNQDKTGMNDLTGPTHLNQINHRPMTMNRTGITNQTRVKITSKPVNHLGELVRGSKELKPVKSKG